MKANNGSGNISDRDNWETPQRLFDKLNSQYRFDFDCCANEQNKKTDLFSSDFETAVKFLPLDRVSCWMNPPFSKAMDMFNVFFDNVKQGVAIYRCDNLETKIWQEVIFPFYDWVFIPKGHTPGEYIET